MSFEKFKKLKYLEIFQSPVGGITNLPNTMKTLLITQKEDTESSSKFNLEYNTIKNISKLKLINSKIDKFKLP